VIALALAAALQELPSRTLSPHAAETTAVRFTPDGRLLVTLGLPDRTVKVWRADTGRLLYELAEKADAFALSQDGALVAAGGAGQASVWGASSGNRLQTLETGVGTALGFGPDGKELVTVWAKPKFDGLTVAVWDVPAGARKRAFSLALSRETVARSVGPHPLLAVAWDDRTVRVWDVPSAKERKLLFGGYERAPRAAFSRDGNLLAVSADHGIEIWDLKEDRKIAPDCRGPGTGVWIASSLDFTADLRTLAAGGMLVHKDAKVGGLTSGPVYFWKIKR
jgi:WD40 repeat protein